MDDNSARSMAEKIESDAFEATNQEADSNPDLRGSDLVMSYARRCGDLMLSALRPGERKEEVTREAAEGGVERVVSRGGVGRIALVQVKLMKRSPHSSQVCSHPYPKFRVSFQRLCMRCNTLKKPLLLSS